MSCGFGWGIDFYAISIARFRLVERVVGGGEEVFEGEEVVPRFALGQADAERGLAVELGDGMGEVDGGEGLAELLDDLFGLVDRGLREGDDEFVAAVAEGEVGLAEGDADAVGEALEEVVAGGVAVDVVDLFEAVEIDHHEGEGEAMAFGEGDFALHEAFHGAAVVEAGEAVGHALLFGLGEQVHGDEGGDGGVDVGLGEVTAVFGPAFTDGEEHVDDDLGVTADVEGDAESRMTGWEREARIDGAADGGAIGAELAREVLAEAGAHGAVHFSDGVGIIQHVERTSGAHLDGWQDVRLMREDGDAAELQLGFEELAEGIEDLLGLAGALDGLRKVEEAVDGHGAFGEDALGLLAAVAGLLELGDHAIESVAEMRPLAAGHGGGFRGFESAVDDLGHAVAKVLEGLEEQAADGGHDDADADDGGEAEDEGEFEGDILAFVDGGGAGVTLDDDPADDEQGAATGDEEAEGGQKDELGGEGRFCEEASHVVPLRKKICTTHCWWLRIHRMRRGGTESIARIVRVIRAVPGAHLLGVSKEGGIGMDARKEGSFHEKIASRSRSRIL